MSSARAWRTNSTASSSGYPWVLARWSPGDWTAIARQFALPLVVWLHACIGLHFAWRLRPWYRAWLPALYAVALLVPVAGIGGARIALRDVADLAQQPGFLNEACSTARSAAAGGHRAASMRISRDPADRRARPAAGRRARRAAGARPVGTARRRRASRPTANAATIDASRPASRSWR